MRSPGGRGFGRGEGGAFGGGPTNPRYTPGNPAGATDYIAAGQEERRPAGAGAAERGPWTPGSRLRDPTSVPDPAFGAGRGERIGLSGERRSLRGTARREPTETGMFVSDRERAKGYNGSFCFFKQTPLLEPPLLSEARVRGDPSFDLHPQRAPLREFSGSAARLLTNLLAIPLRMGMLLRQKTGGVIEMTAAMLVAESFHLLVEDPVGVKADGGRPLKKERPPTARILKRWVDVSRNSQLEN